MKSVLIIDEDNNVRTSLSRFLGRHHYRVQTCASYTDAGQMLRQEKFHLVFYDYNINSAYSIPEFLQRIKILQPATKVIFTAANAAVDTAVSLIKSGADNYLSKPFYQDELLQCIERTLAQQNEPQPLPARVQEKARPLKNMSPIKEKYIMGDSKNSRELYRNVGIVAPTNFSVILYGETGTGKESLARLLHGHSHFAQGPFVAIDCGSLSKELASSELFGHEKGAFTGASQSKTGAFELADGGTLFLDEIGNLDYEIQTSLLRAIQEKVIRKVGGTREISTNMRFVVASNESLPELVQKGTFREDLYYRLNEFELIVPPLRERKEDLNAFINSFFEESCEELQKNIPGIESGVWGVLHNYNWPGNIRELKNTIRRACLLCTEGQMIKRKAFPPEILNPLPVLTSAPATAVPDLELYEEPDHQHIYGLKDAALRAEYSKIIQVLKRVKYNKTKAAALLNIDRKTLYNKLKFIPVS